MTDEIRRGIRVDPIPKNVHPEYNRGRRKARAKASTDIHGSDQTARFVDTAECEGEDRFTLTVVSADETTRTAATVTCNNAEEA